MPVDLLRSISKCFLILLILCAARLSGAASVDDAMSMLHSSIDQILSVAYSGQGNENLSARVRPLLERIFALDLVTRQAMGPGWRQFSPADKKRITGLFSELMLRTYSARVVGTERPKITYGTPVELASDRTEVPSRVTTSTSNEPIAVVYRLIKLPVGWRIYDVLIEGVSFVSNYRAQFDEIIHRGGAPAVIRALEAKLAAPANSNS
ncbi:MAG: ABC transporter substrate-binding protein [Verrucomicrobia bacterium]|nr:ABC transporter substrate-binding protein [Verrucomicrobiota bacterium]